MSDKTAHLIERAAAFLRSGGAGLPAMPPPIPDSQAEFEALPIAAPPSFQPSTPFTPPLTDDDDTRPAAVVHDPMPDYATPLADEPIDLPGGDSGDDPAFLSVDMLKNAGLVLLSERTRTTEEFRISVGRILRSLRSLNGGAGANLVMITSARPGEGKSFSAINLAASMAQNGMSDVVMIDADGKPSSTTALMGLRYRTGLFDLAEDPRLRIEDVVIPTEVRGLSLIPLGGQHTHTDGGITRPVSAAIERIARRYPDRIILIDTPPCLYTSDPSTLASLVDMVLLVIEAEKTQRSEIEASLELVHACPNVMLMLNKVKTRSDASFGAYYYYSGYPT